MEYLAQYEYERTARYSVAASYRSIYTPMVMEIRRRLALIPGEDDPALWDAYRKAHDDCQVLIDAEIARANLLPFDYNLEHE